MKWYLTIVVLILVGFAAYALDHGIYVGSRHALSAAPCCPDSAEIQKRCRYLFVTGISEINAQDGQISVYAVTSDAREAGFGAKEIVEDIAKNGIPAQIAKRISVLDNGYCRLFAQ